MKSRPLRHICAAVLACAATSTFAVAAATPVQAQEPERPAFYEPPTELPEHNGDVIRSEPAEFFLDPAKLVKVNANVNRVMYRSTDGHGEPIAVTGTVLTPKTPWLGQGERPIIGYAPGTQGLGDHCAPSRQLANGSEYEGYFINNLLVRGYAIAMTDYEGLGTPGMHTYVNREVEGNAVLDSVRAAQRLPEAGVPESGPVAIAGYSQGGGASAAAAELAHEYAPELDLKGVAAGAVPAELGAVGAHLDGGAYAAYLLYAAAGLAAGYDIDPAPILNDEGEALFEEVEQYCVIEATARYSFQQSKDFTEDGRPLTDYLAEEPFKSVVAEQYIGARKPEVPVLVSHSVLDDVIPFDQGKNLAASWCSQGADVEFAPNAGPTHVGGAVASFPKVFAWFEARFADRPTAPNC